MSSRARWNTAAAIIEPDPATREFYDTLYSLYRDLYPATWPAWLIAWLKYRPRVRGTVS